MDDSSFAPYWKSYCENNQISYKLVCCYDNNIIEQVRDCDVLMWHHLHTSSKDVLFARQLLFALEQTGTAVFPNFNTGWHFDDKVGQKYLLEAMDVPLVPSFVFYDKARAMRWLHYVKYPIVFKLRGGAGASNVRLVKTERQAIGLVNTAFGKGFKQYNAFSSLKERYKKFKEGKVPAFEVLKGIVRLGYEPRYSKVMGRERGYVYFQTFMEGNDCDIRVIVINHKAFALKRMVRSNDFRASGSGDFRFEKEEFDLKCIRIAFDTTKIMAADCVAFDFVYAGINDPRIVEISYGFGKEAYDNCPGYFDENLEWHEEKFDPQGWMVEAAMKLVENESSTYETV